MANYVIAKEDDGGIQITFTIPYKDIKKEQEITATEMAGNYNVPGFRKGKAPVSEVLKRIPKAELIEHSLGHILPHALNEAIQKEKLSLAMYPKYELISSEENKDWEIRALTCEVPEINLGKYKTELKGKLKDLKDKPREEKEQEVLKMMLEKVKIKIAKILINEEVNARLSSLLSRIEKLGLTLEGYLASMNKKPDDIRVEYETQANQALTVEFMLTRIAEEEKLKVDPKEIEAAMKMTADSDTEAQSRYIESVLRRRQALDFLITLAS